MLKWLYLPLFNICGKSVVDIGIVNVVFFAFHVYECNNVELKVLQNVMKTFLTFLINKRQYKTSYLIFAAEIKINIKNTTAFFNAMQTSCIKNRCMMDVLKVILFCSWGWSTRCARFPIYPTYKIKSHF
jgi:hypothetical protein